MNKSYMVENLDHFGRGIIRIGGKPIFVDDALPGEEVQINITVDKKKYGEGNVTNYIKKSPLRVEPICPYYKSCGGCDLMHLTYEKQLKYKEKKVKEIINKFVGLDCVNPITGTHNLEYRNKITLHVNKKMGYFQKKSYEIVTINNCLIANKKINVIIKRLNGFNLDNINKVIIRSTLSEIMLILFVNDNFDDSISHAFKDIDSLIVINKEKIKVIHGKAFIEEKIDNLKFVISPLSFFQVNPDGMSKIYNKALEYAELKKQDKVLDLYCGTGTIGIYAAKKASEVLGIEINEEAIKDANKNKYLNNLKNISFRSGDTKDILVFKDFKPSVIFVDPPRNGLDKKVIDKILKYEPQKLVYISCDPVTLARDLNILKEKYEIKEIAPFDMFPNNYHVECVSLLVRKTLEK